MATTEVEDRRTAVLRPGGLVPIAVGDGVRQMPFGDEMNGAFHDLGDPGKHGQGQNEGAEFGRSDVHRLAVYRFVLVV